MFHKVVPVLGSMFGKTKAYKYLPKSTEKFMTKVELAVLLTGSGFEEVGFKTLFFGNICMHWGVKP
jgi:demethylmenaquinone methyltransferase/2-methoxy-6-polyprenyl-1,4-benzoquinol methylase